MEIQPSPRNDKDIESQDDSPQPILAEDENLQPIVIRKLDRVETTKRATAGPAALPLVRNGRCQ
jgi:hypothetical protein